MSRSRRKTPIFGNSTSRSEKQDKRIWHSRLRAHERTTLTTLSPAEMEGAVLPDVNDVSNPWSMDKDGRQWWPPSHQTEVAERIATRQASTPAERALLKERLLHKWMGK